MYDVLESNCEREDPVALSLIRLISCLMGWDWESLPE